MWALEGGEESVGKVIGFLDEKMKAYGTTAERDEELLETLR